MGLYAHPCILLDQRMGLEWLGPKLLFPECRVVHLHRLRVQMKKRDKGNGGLLEDTLKHQK